MKINAIVVAFFTFVMSVISATNSGNCVSEQSIPSNPKNNCVSFSVSSGTGCAWMCNYCASQLGTNNYYFTTDVCTYQTGGCVGNPIAGVTYTCCSV